MDEVELTEERINKIIELVKKCNHIDKEIISYIRREGIDITFDEFFAVYDYLENNFTLGELEKMGFDDDHFSRFIVILYNEQDIYEFSVKNKFYDFIFEFIEIKKSFGLEVDTNLDFNKLIELAINDNDFHRVFEILNNISENVSDENKLKIIDNLENATSLYRLSNKNLLMLMSFAKDNNIPIEKFEKCFKNRQNFIVELCYSCDEELISYYLDIATEDEKRFISIVNEVKNLPTIDIDIYRKLLERLPEDDSLRSMMTLLAVRKGFRPTLEELKSFPNYYQLFRSSLEYLAKDNIAYIPLMITSGDFGLSLTNLSREFDLPCQKVAFDFLNELNKGLFVHYEIDDTLFYCLSRENISKYFDEKGCKKEFLFKLIDDYIEIASKTDDNPFIRSNDPFSPTPNKTKFNIRNIKNLKILEYVYDNCKNSLTGEEKIYGLITSLIINRKYLSATNDTIINEIVSSIYSGKTDINNLLEEFNHQPFLIINLVENGLLSIDSKENLTSEERIMIDICQKVFSCSENRDYCLNLLKRLTDNFSHPIEVIDDAFIDDLISHKDVELLKILGKSYLTEEQINFINIVGDGIKDFDDENFIEFVKNTLKDPSELDKYLFGDMPTSLLLDRLFENGILIDMSKYSSLLNEEQKIILDVYNEIEDKELKSLYCEFIKECYHDNFKGDLIKKIPELLERVKYSNSSDIAGRYISITREILSNAQDENFDPVKKFAEIEQIFLRKDLLHSEKIFTSFRLLYPHDKLLEEISTKSSPVLLYYKEHASDTALGREAKRLYGDASYAIELLLYADLLKTSILSNDKSILEFVNTLEKGNIILKDLVEGKIKVEELEPGERMIIGDYLKITLGDSFETSDLKTAIYNIQNSDINIGELPDKVIKDKIGRYLGISSLEELKNMMEQAKTDTNNKGRVYSKKPLTLEKGDLVKGLGFSGMQYFETIISNGSVSKEFLGGSVESDFTPFDTDLSYILESGLSIEEAIKKTPSNSCGPIFFVIKQAEERCLLTRGVDKEGNFEENSENLGKMELFQTSGSDHFGIRTGFPSTQVDYIYCENMDLVPKIGLVLAMNGLYIPVCNNKGEIVFTPDDYDKMRSKMGGLSHYGVNDYDFSDKLSNPYTSFYEEKIPASMTSIASQKSRLEGKMREGFLVTHKRMKLGIDGDLSTGSVEVIDTGSTGRGTNVPGDADFDYTVRIDRLDCFNKEREGALKRGLCQELGIKGEIGDIRKAKVDIGGEEVEVDISYAAKSDKITYTTDMSLCDRLDTIKRIDPNKHRQVLANIILAKSILKSGNCYKPHHASGGLAQGGLGGVGVESWILQNGGSLEQATLSFLDASGVLSNIDGEIVIDESKLKEWSTFNQEYQVWDFGQNQLSEERRKGFPYDNFIYNNMDREGYMRMVRATSLYLKALHPEIQFIPNDQLKEKDKKDLQEVTTNVTSFLDGIVPERKLSSEVSKADEIESLFDDETSVKKGK